MPRQPRSRRMVVREVVPGRGWLLGGALLALVLIAGVSGWVAGRHFLLAGLAVGDGSGGGAALLERLADENRTMRDELAVSRNGNELSREVEERVRTDNRDLQDRIAELEQAVASYRKVAVQDAGGKGVWIDRIDLLPAAAASRWSLSVSLVRSGGTDSALEGYLEGTLLADGPSGRVALPLAQLMPSAARNFRVRYVTEVKAELQLPPALVPVRLDLAAVLTAPRPGRVAKSWQRHVVRAPVTATKVARAQEGVRDAGQE